MEMGWMETFELLGLNLLVALLLGLVVLDALEQAVHYARRTLWRSTSSERQRPTFGAHRPA